MFLYQFPEFMFAFIVLFLSMEVHCQRIRFDNYYYETFTERPRAPASSSECDSNSYCVSIRRCPQLRDRRDWRTAGVTCEPGYGMYRSVCCPRRRSNVLQSPRNTSPRTTTIRSVTEDFINNVIINADCGQSRTGNIARMFVMGGENVTEGAYPWMVAITRRSSSGVYNVWCTGFLIDRRHVLSAAHCFRRREDGLYSTRIGRVNQNEGEEYPIARITVPDGYTPGLFYSDLAVLTLSREVNFPNFNPICLPDAELSGKDLSGFGATIVGWGANRTQGDMSDILQQLRGIPIVSNQECNRVLRQRVSSFQRQFSRGIDGGFLCAAFPEGGKDACGGDSGGPLMYQERNRWFAIGIVSFGFNCGLPGVPGGYTRVSNYLNWIRQNTRD